MKKLILCMCVLLCACTSAKQPEPVTEETVKKPEKISVHFEGYEDEFEGKSSIKDICQQYEADTGIKLDVEDYQGGSYYNGVLLSNLAQGKYEDIPDVLFVPYWFYERGSRYGWFWDMTDAWENSSIRSITDEKYVDAAKIDGRLYGFPANRYKGTVTYIRKDWLEATGQTVQKLIFCYFMSNYCILFRLYVI